MPNYCDPKVLEHNWFMWRLAMQTPSLNQYRDKQQLWTKCDPQLTFPQPLQHAVTIGGVHYNVEHIVLNNLHAWTINTPINSIPNGYVQEPPISYSWDELQKDIYKICNGISTRFYRTDEQRREELAQNAYTTIGDRIKRQHLTYTPGVAPVFSFMTTVIQRTMLSIIRKDKERSEKIMKHHQKVINIIPKV